MFVYVDGWVGSGEWVGEQVEVFLVVKVIGFDFLVYKVWSDVDVVVQIYCEGCMDICVIVVIDVFGV